MRIAACSKQADLALQLRQVVVDLVKVDDLESYVLATPIVDAAKRAHQNAVQKRLWGAHAS